MLRVLHTLPLHISCTGTEKAVASPLETLRTTEPRNTEKPRTTWTTKSCSWFVSSIYGKTLLSDVAREQGKSLVNTSSHSNIPQKGREVEQCSYMGSTALGFPGHLNVPYKLPPLVAIGAIHSRESKVEVYAVLFLLSQMALTARWEGQLTGCVETPCKT